ncbi:YjcZ family sporulation protein [Parageobacillus toebii]|uniref:YjcZ family sporulation protein n=1 Tax=Parageobacillus toebii TaxID=153151 RepID=UPI0009EEED25
MVYYSYREEKSNVLNRAHRAISTSEVFAHESLVELESVSMRRYGRSSIVHKNPVALAIGRFSLIVVLFILLIIVLAAVR